MAFDIEGFDITDELGRGGFGVVHRAVQPALSREVAIKVLNADVGDAVAMARFERECQAIGALSAHPNVVSVFQNGVTGDGRPFLVMEYLAGGTLADRCPLPWEQSVEVGVRVAGALAAAHRAGIIHRDVKPQNVLFTEFEIPQLADFGIASMIDGFETQSSSLSASLAYAAPEVLDSRPSSPQSDIYSLAATIVGAILGHPPFHREADTNVALIARIATAPVPDLRDQGLPAEVCQVLEQAMAKRPEDRQSDAASFGAALAAAAGIEPGIQLTGAVPVVVVAGSSLGAAEASEAPAQPPRTARRKRRVLITAATVTALLAGAGVALAAGEDDDSGKVRLSAPEPSRISAVTTTVVALDPLTLDPLTTVETVPTQEVASLDPSVPPATGGSFPSAATPNSAAGAGTRSATTKAGGPAAVTSPTGGTVSGASSVGAQPESVTTRDDTVVTTTPVAAAAPTTTVGNQAPTLPVKAFRFDAPINVPTTLVAASDKSLSAGWVDPDGTSAWLCLVAAGVTQDFWIDGMNCEGGGLWVNATTPGLRTIRLWAVECDAQSVCGSPRSVGERTVEVNFYVP